MSDQDKIEYLERKLERQFNFFVGMLSVLHPTFKNLSIDEVSERLAKSLEANEPKGEAP